MDWFQTEDDCLAYIEKLRWNGRFRCKYCDSDKAWTNKRGSLECSGCRRQNSITADTIFQDTRKPLRLWFHVMWFVMAQKTGVSAENLRESMGFGSYQTIWAWLHKFRMIMVRPGRDKLEGEVEVDETFIGSKEKDVKGRETERKTLVVVAVEGIHGQRLGRVRFRCIPDASADHLVSFITDYVQVGSKIITDAWLGYAGLDKKGYNHETRVISRSKEGAHEVLPHVHLVINLAKRWLRGTHQGAPRPQHLQAYLDEFAFRFNRRTSTHRGKLFYRLMEEAVSTSLPPIKSLYVKKLVSRH